MSRCIQCASPAKFMCSGCDEVTYCDSRCQGVHWGNEHKLLCGTKLDDAVSSIVASYGDITNLPFEGKTPVKPTFIIAYGPPGSGKSTIVKNIYKNPERRIREDEVVEVDSDQIVSSIPGYQEELVKLMKGDSAGRQRLYWNARKAADSIGDKILDDALLQKFSVRWETTGGSISWTGREINRIKRMGYRIWIVYPVVETDELEKRIKQRERETGQPALPMGILHEIISNSRDNLSHLLGLADRTIVYDNTLKATRAGKQGRVLFELETIYTNQTKDTTLTSKVISCVHCVDDNGDSKREIRDFYKEVLGETLYNALIENCEKCVLAK